ncbi:GTP-binding protein [uncultured Limnobacter sp.]|uniref:GTP-binding protein n=1 Tax=Limnobacter sp. TaxID=2003368 RepID=UPI0030FC5007
MKTHLFLVSGRNPVQRATRIEQLLLEQTGAGKITLMASTEIFSVACVEAQAELFQLDAERKARGIHVLRLSPGCLCCSSKLVLTTHLARTLRLNQPNVLLMELESQSHPEQVLKLLNEPQWTDWFADIKLVEEVA